MRKYFYVLRLQRFAEGGSEGADSGVTSQDAAGSTGEATSQDAAAEAQETRVSFDELIKGEYKEKGIDNLIPVPYGTKVEPLSNVKLADSQFLELKQYLIEE